MTLTAYGRKEWMGGGLLSLAAITAGIVMIRQGNLFIGWLICVLAALAWLALAAFFRVPRRIIPKEPGLLLSPADGVVRDIGTVKSHGIELHEGMEMIRIGIFLSVLDVHVNRAPCTLRVVYRRHRPGRHLDARKPRSSRENESLTMAGTGEVSGESFPVAVRQISGAVARRIVCDVQPGDTLKTGQIYGMIKFGSRTELFIPADGRMHVLVKEGQRVSSGTSVLACLETNED